MDIILKNGCKYNFIKLGSIYNYQKEFESVSGVYCILSLCNSKIYIGSSKNIYKRIRDHFYLLKNYKHYNTYLNMSFLKYGKSNFCFSVIEECGIDKLIDREQFYIDDFKCTDKNIGYNIAVSANNTIVSEETRRKISESLIGKPGRRLGFKVSESTKEKLRVIFTGKVCSEETKIKISESLKGVNVWAKGTIKGPRSAEIKAKISLKNRGSGNGMAKPVIFIKDGRIEKRWLSACEAAEFYNIKAYTLRKYIHNNTCFSGGFFKYE